MALINTIREKSGWAVGIIAIGLLLFIVGGDLIGGRNRLFGRNDQVIGTINGDKIEAKDFLNELEQAKQSFTNQQGRPPDEQTLSYLREQVWNQMLYKHTFLPEIDKLGLQVSDEELVDMVQGDNINPMLKQSFTDPKTGQFSKEALLSYLRNLGQNPQQQAQFQQFESDLQHVQGPMMKYNDLLKNSVYVTTAEVKAFDNAQNSKANFRYLFVPYTSVSDSAFKPTDEQLQDYLTRHKGRYQVEAGRSIEYIVVPDVASKEDSAAIRQTVADLAQQFGTTSNDSLFVRANSEQPYSHAYIPAAQLPEQLTKQQPLKTGQVYGPFTIGNALALYKITGQKDRPTMRASHILFQPAGNTPEAKAEAKAKAEQVLAKIKAGADFAAMAKEYGSDGTKDKGGDLGFFDRGAMVPEFSKAVYGAPGLGLIPNLVETNFGYHIVKVTGKKEEPSYQIASVLKTVQPSEATHNASYEKAEQLAADATTLDAFRQLPSKDKTLQKQEAKYVPRNAQTLNNLTGVREIVRWAYGDSPDGEVNLGTVKKFDNGDQHIIAALVDAREKGTATLESIRPELTAQVRNELKAKSLLAKLQGKTGTLEELAKLAGPGTVVQTAEGVAAGQGLLPNVGFEPDAVSRAFALKPGQKSAPIQGEQGVLVVEGVAVTPPTAAADLKAVRQQLTQQRQQRQESLVLEALKANSKVVDDRGRFF